MASLPYEIITPIVNDDDVIGSVASAPHNQLLLNDLQLNNLKADKIIGATNGNIVTMDSFGNIRDDGIAPSDFESAFSKNTAFNKNFGSGHLDVPYGDHTHSAINPLSTSSGLTGSRVAGTEYTNSTGKTMMVIIEFVGASNVGTATGAGYVGGVVKNRSNAYYLDYAGDRERYTGKLIWMVPNGSTYKILWEGNAGSISYWYECY